MNIETQTLSVNIAKKIIGKTIKWSAPGAFENGAYVGTSKILDVHEGWVNPLSCDALSGESLEYAFNEWGSGKKLTSPLAYSDEGRYITFSIID